MFTKLVMKNIAVFCAASDAVAPQFVQAAREVGRLIGSMGCALVYGGARAGLMETTAAAAKEAGAHVVGVVPLVLEERNRVSALLDENIHTRDLSERKDIMVQRSDVLVALPGGIGTLDEVFHTMAAATIGFHKKRVVLYNVDGFWDPLLAMLQQMSADKFVRGALDDFLVVVASIEELEQIIKDA